MKTIYKNVLAGIGASVILIMSIVILISSLGSNNEGGLSASSISSTNNSKSSDTYLQKQAGDPSISAENACGLTQQWTGFSSNLDLSRDNYLGNMYVINGNDIQVFVKDKYSYTLQSKYTKTTFNQPSAVAIDSEGNMYVADTGNNKIQKLSHSLSGGFIFEKSWIVSKPTDIAIPYDSTNQYIYILSNSKQILKALPTDISFVPFTNYTNTKSLQHISISPFNFQSASALYVTDSGNHKVIKFDMNGKVQKEWGKFGAAEGYFNTPSGIAAETFSIAVADTGNNRVQIFNQNGDFVTSISGVFNGKDIFNNPTDLASNFEQYYIADNKGNFSKIGINCGNIVVKKEVKPLKNSTNFKFKIFSDFNNNASFSVDFLLNDDGEDYINKPTRQATFGVAPGKYNILEDFYDDSYQTSYKCSSSIPGTQVWSGFLVKKTIIEIKGTETVTCTFTNHKLPIGDTPTKKLKL